MVLILPLNLDTKRFDEGWPDFLEVAEQMPGLIQESVTRFDQSLFGSSEIQRLYTFSFKDRHSLENALTSQAGEKAGDIRHSISGGNISILAGDHQTDSLERIQSFSSSVIFLSVNNFGCPFSEMTTYSKDCLLRYVMRKLREV